MRLRFQHIAFFVLIAGFTACVDDGPADIPSYAGTWEVQQYTSDKFEHGKVVEHLERSGQTVVIGTDPEDVFHPITIDTALAQNYVPSNYLLGRGWDFSNGGKTISGTWEAEDEELRFYFWGLAGSSRYIKWMNLERKGRNEMIWTYLETNDSTSEASMTLKQVVHLVKR